MKLIFINDLVPGMLTAQDVRTEEGLLKLLSKGAVLNQSQINKIKNWGLATLYIEEFGDDTEGKGIALSLTRDEFVKFYKETVLQITDAFRHIEKFHEVPIIKMQELAEERVSLLIDTIGALEYLREIRGHSEHTFEHSLHVAVVAGIIGKWYGYKGSALKNLVLAGLLHDIGKMFVPLSILDKPGRLTVEEFAVIQQHPAQGYQILKDDERISKSVKLGIWQHHERIDGSGYPCRLTDHEICEEAKIIAVADVYDAMTADRVYRRKMTPFQALDIMAEEMFVKLEPDICLVFLDNMREYLTGSHVALSNGQKAKVIAFNSKYRYFTKPVVCMKNGDLLNLQSAKIDIVSVH